MPPLAVGSFGFGHIECSGSSHNHWESDNQPANNRPNWKFAKENVCMCIYIYIFACMRMFYVCIYIYIYMMTYAYEYANICNIHNSVHTYIRTCKGCKHTSDHKNGLELVDRYRKSPIWFFRDSHVSNVQRVPMIFHQGQLITAFHASSAFPRSQAPAGPSNFPWRAKQQTRSFANFGLWRLDLKPMGFLINPKRIKNNKTNFTYQAAFQFLPCLLHLIGT